MRSAYVFPKLNHATQNKDIQDGKQSKCLNGQFPCFTSVIKQSQNWQNHSTIDKDCTYSCFIDSFFWFAWFSQQSPKYHKKNLLRLVRHFLQASWFSWCPTTHHFNGNFPCKFWGSGPPFWKAAIPNVATNPNPNTNPNTTNPNLWNGGPSEWRPDTNLGKPVAPLILILHWSLTSESLRDKPKSITSSVTQSPSYLFHVYPLSSSLDHQHLAHHVQRDAKPKDPETEEQDQGWANFSRGGPHWKF